MRLVEVEAKSSFQEQEDEHAYIEKTIGRFSYDQQEEVLCEILAAFAANRVIAFFSSRCISALLLISSNARVSLLLHTCSFSTILLHLQNGFCETGLRKPATEQVSMMWQKLICICSTNL